MNRRHELSDRDAGFSLIEVLVTVVVVGLLTAPLAGLVSMAISRSADAERTAQRTSSAQVALSFATALPVVDECDQAGLLEAVKPRVPLRDGWEFALETDCSEVVHVVTVTVTDPMGRSLQLTGVRN